MSKLKTNNKYVPSEIEKKWQRLWEKEKIYSPDLDASASLSAKKPFYNLMMFPYPSAEGMHVGNMYAFTGADVYGRFKRMQGFSVFEPIGLDGFGIHSENYAIKVGTHPVEQAKISEKNFYRQLRSIGNGFDWTRTVETYKPEYYKWTQWLFIQLFKAGLAYRKKAPVNFCPSCKTVLADEQVIDGLCERCNSVAEKRDLEQWFFKITKYADRLLDNLTQIDWAEKVKIAQREWIGRSEGTLIRFNVILNSFQDPGSLGNEMPKRAKYPKGIRHDNEQEIEVFTTRVDTLFGATFLVLSPEHPIVSVILNSFQNLGSLGYEIPKQVRDDMGDYVEEAKKKTEQERGAEKEKTGVFSGLYAINPVNQGKIPVWIADYAVMGYGTGALFGDAHDERDMAFAKKYKIPLKPTLKTENKELDKRIQNLEECFTGEGILFDSGEFSGLTSKEAKKRITEWLNKNKSGGPKTTYHLRDWLISRQRYWGPPIPMIFCPTCAKASAGKGDAGWQPVPEKDLPVKLPFVEDYKPLGTGKAPLASHPEFYKTKCPNCGGEAKRETDVSDTFLDSSWYFLRYLATEWNDIPFPSNVILNSFQDLGSSKNEMLKPVQHDIEERKRWLPVNMYIGGAEHSVLHLLYSRFITMALKDLGHISFEEPFIQFRAHGLIVKDGAKMSKSKGNVVVPDAYIKKFGADTLRAYLMFMGPYSQGGDFRDSGIEGMSKFLKRIWTLFSAGPVPSFPPASAPSADAQVRAVGSPSSGATRLKMLHKTIKKVTEDIEGLSYNTAIAALMEWYNFLSDQKSVSREELEAFLKLLAPFAPHMAEELFSMINADSKTDPRGSAENQWKSIHLQRWPSYDEKYLVASEVIIAIQINGKLRDTIRVQSAILRQAQDKSQKDVEQMARESAKVHNHLKGKKILKVVYVTGKIINFVVL
ncbi:MAG: leucine--tRNA ligase [Candidatus Levybacteria bacterium]|nr:leucine--tRNA ligase [Candidatus Levybacteria bacterium]